MVSLKLKTSFPFNINTYVVTIVCLLVLYRLQSLTAEIIGFVILSFTNEIYLS